MQIPISRHIKVISVSAFYLVAALTPSTAFAANTESYCNSIAEMATGYVGDRNYGWPYSKTLAVLNAAVDQAKLSDSQRTKYRRDAQAAAKIAYIDFPKITEQGIYKLVHLGCMSE